MSDRIFDLSTEPARLHVDLGRLIVQRKGHDDLATPLDEVAVVIGAHRQLSYTNSVLSGLATHGGAMVVCDDKSMPVGLMLPIAGHHLQSERFAQQAAASKPVNKRLWQQIVRTKVRAQGGLLKALHGDDKGLPALAEKVQSGDPANIEAQASRRYWPALFTNPDFRRDRDAEDQNRLLNYGYGVLRALTGRAVCAAGLHPTLGLHHHNRYDAYCLADDLMEPFRPVVDHGVYRHVWTTGKADAPLDKDAKGAILRHVLGRFSMEGEQRTLFDILARTAASLARVYAGEAKELALPELY